MEHYLRFKKSKAKITSLLVEEAQKRSGLKCIPIHSSYGKLVHTCTAFSHNHFRCVDLCSMPETDDWMPSTCTMQLFILLFASCGHAMHYHSTCSISLFHSAIQLTLGCPLLCHAVLTQYVRGPRFSQGGHKILTLQCPRGPITPYKFGVPLGLKLGAPNLSQDTIRNQF